MRPRSFSSGNTHIGFSVQCVVEITRPQSFISGNISIGNQNQTFRLDSHRLFICSAVYSNSSRNICLCSSFRQGKSLPAPSTSEDSCNYKLQGHFTECRYFLSLSASATHPGYSYFQIMVTVAPCRLAGNYYD
jgi:hypothetical protein